MSISTQNNNTGTFFVRRAHKHTLKSFPPILFGGLLFMLISAPFVFAYDIAVTPITQTLPDNGVIPKLFRIENLDHQSGVQFSIAVNLSYNITTMNNLTSELLFFNGTSFHVINKFTTNTVGVSTNGSWVFACAHIIVNVSDPNLSNNQGCWNITSFDDNPQEPENPDEPPEDDAPSDPLPPPEDEQPQDPPEDEPDCSSMNITGVPFIVDSGTQIRYSFVEWKTGDSVTYWVEDIFGRVVKTAVTTTSKASKTYTPRINSELMAFYVLAQRTRADCPLDEAQVLFLVKGLDHQDADDSFDDEIVLESIIDSVSAGELFELSLDISKSDNRRRVITVKVAGKSSRVVLTTKGRYELTLALSAPYHCGPSKHSEIRIEGLGTLLSIPVEILSQPCAVQESSSNSIHDDIPLISSLYTRAQNFQDEINVFGHSTSSAEVLVLQVVNTSVVNGSFTVRVNPQAGNNTFVVGSLNGSRFSGRAVQFSLRSLEPQTTSSQEFVHQVQSSNQSIMNNTASLITGHHVFSQSTEEVLIEPQQDYTIAIIGGFLVTTIFLAGIAKRKRKTFKKNTALNSDS